MQLAIQPDLSRNLRIQDAVSIDTKGTKKREDILFYTPEGELGIGIAGSFRNKEEPCFLPSHSVVDRFRSILSTYQSADNNGSFQTEKSVYGIGFVLDSSHSLVTIRHINARIRRVYALGKDDELESDHEPDVLLQARNEVLATLRSLGEDNSSEFLSKILTQHLTSLDGAPAGKVIAACNVLVNAIIGRYLHNVGHPAIYEQAVFSDRYSEDDVLTILSERMSQGFLAPETTHMIDRSRHRYVSNSGCAMQTMGLEKYTYSSAPLRHIESWLNFESLMRAIKSKRPFFANGGALSACEQLNNLPARGRRRW